MKNSEVVNYIHSALKKQKVGVLATSGANGPYQSLVAFTVLPDLKEIVFATDKNTTKYKNIIQSHEVSLLIDNRTEKLNNFKDIVVVTAVGDAREVERVFEEGPGQEYMECHPLLSKKFLTESGALISIKVKKYIIVSSLSEVNEYFP